MIARLAATDRGPELVRITRSRDDRRATIVVSRSLYTSAPPERWPVEPDRDDLLHARSGTVRYGAKGEIARAAASRLPGVRLMLIPEDLVRRRGRRLRRSIAVQSRRFRTVEEMRRWRRHAGTACLMALCAAIMVVADRTATDAGMTIDAAARAATERDQLSGQMASLRETRERLLEAAASTERRPGLPPGRLADAVVALLGPGETLQSLQIDGDQISVVVTTDAVGFAERLGMVTGIVPIAETVTRDVHGVVSAIRARIGE